MNFNTLVHGKLRSRGLPSPVIAAAFSALTLRGLRVVTSFFCFDEKTFFLALLFENPHSFFKTMFIGNLYFNH